jgi:hypothetical protein
MTSLAASPVDLHGRRPPAARGVPAPAVVVAGALQVLYALQQQSKRAPLLLERGRVAALLCVQRVDARALLVDRGLGGRARRLLRYKAAYDLRGGVGRVGARARGGGTGGARGRPALNHRRPARTWKPYVEGRVRMRAPIGTPQPAAQPASRRCRAWVALTGGSTLPCCLDPTAPRRGAAPQPRPWAGPPTSYSSLCCRTTRAACSSCFFASMSASACGDAGGRGAGAQGLSGRGCAALVCLSLLAGPAKASL